MFRFGFENTLKEVFEDTLHESVIALIEKMVKMSDLRLKIHFERNIVCN